MNISTPIRIRLIQLLTATLIVIAVSAVQAEPLRIVSMAPSTTSIVADLKLGASLVGLTEFCDRPENATDAQIIGTITHPNLESIASLKPDLVALDTGINRPEFAQRLEDLGLNLLKLEPAASFDSIARNVFALADAAERRPFAEQQIQKARQEIQTITDALQTVTPKRVFVEVWPNPLITVSKQAFIHHAVKAAGGVNVFADEQAAYPKISLESVMAEQPEIVLILTHSLIDRSRIETYQGFPAFENADIIQIDSAEASQPGLSAFVNAVRLLAPLIHPEAFEDAESRNDE